MFDCSSTVQHLSWTVKLISLLILSYRKMSQHPSQRHHAFVWGSNSCCGRLALGDAFSGWDFMHNPSKLNDDDIGVWTQIACGGSHTVALSPKGEVFTWGHGNYGQLGHGDRESRNVPTKVESLSQETIVKVSCGLYHTAAVTSTGKLLTWYVP